MKRRSDTQNVDHRDGRNEPDERPNHLRMKSSRLELSRKKVPSMDSAKSNQETHKDASSELAHQIQRSSDSTEYRDQRATLLASERERRWDENARLRASKTELQAAAILYKIREFERVDPGHFGNVPGEAVPDREKTRDMGDRFLVNKANIEDSRVFSIAKGMPKGAHLHLHFNSELPPEKLLEHLRKSETVKDTMFIRSTRPLCTDEDYTRTEIVFSVLPKDTTQGDIFSPDYKADWKSPSNSAWMKWVDFRERFPRDRSCLKQEKEISGLEDIAELWAREKMIITLELAYGERQTTNGAWACFNQGTRAFKGLLNYESIYRWYIQEMIDSMIEDRVMYAELRPMLMDKWIPSDDGARKLDHRYQMRMICEEVKERQAELMNGGQIDKFPFGLRIIYCTPRSIPRERMQVELEDCLKLKLAYPDLICGFDLVGAEDRPSHIGYYADLLVAFTKSCSAMNLQIPFMFHAGETSLDTGGSPNPDNSNLYDSLLLNAKRIGHGYSLLKHPLLVEEYKKRNICLELCPISNEVLHMCGNVKQHIFPELLATGLHCSLNADNPSLYSSSLSHEFYQVMVGDTRMNLHGWKQLAEWSLEHSCLTESQLETGKQIFADKWQEYCHWIVQEYGTFAATLDDPK